MTEAYRLVEEVWIDAPPARVYRAWTERAELLRWWGVPGEYETTTADVDVREGGRYRFAGTSAAMGAFEVTGEYRVVDPPGRLVYTWKPSWDDDAHGSVVELTFEPEDGGTRLIVQHTAFVTESARDDHREGWPAVLAMLRGYLEAEPTP